jgi:hypothetical protein
LLPLFVLLAGCPGAAPHEPDGTRIWLDGTTGPRDGATDRPKSPPADKGLPPADKGAPTPDKGAPSKVVPPLGGSSQGSGGGAAPSGQVVQSGGVSFVLIVPSGYKPGAPNRALIIYSGTEGASVMANNMLSVGPSLGLGDAIVAVLDGKTYYGNGQAGASALDYVRAKYNVDNDRTYLLSESAGTSAGLLLGFQLRQSYFAAYWANDVNASATPAKSAAQLGFAPWGNAGPGGQFTAANAIVAGMKSKGYRLPSDAPYSGTGASQHGSTQQFMAALTFFGGKSRK